MCSYCPICLEEFESPTAQPMDCDIESIGNLLQPVTPIINLVNTTTLSCRHEFCHDCLYEYCVHSIHSLLHVPIPCPMNEIHAFSASSKLSSTKTTALPVTGTTLLQGKASTEELSTERNATCQNVLTDEFVRFVLVTYKQLLLVQQQNPQQRQKYQQENLPQRLRVNASLLSVTNCNLLESPSGSPLSLSTNSLETVCKIFTTETKDTVETLETLESQSPLPVTGENTATIVSLVDATTTDKNCNITVHEETCLRSGLESWKRYQQLQLLMQRSGSTSMCSSSNSSISSSIEADSSANKTNNHKTNNKRKGQKNSNMKIATSIKAANPLSSNTSGHVSRSRPRYVACPRCNEAVMYRKKKKCRNVTSNNSNDNNDNNNCKDYNLDDHNNDSQPLNAVTCLACQHVFCRVHGDAHNVMTVPCSEYTSSPDYIASLQYIKDHAKPCSHCNAPIEKSSGCDHIVCGSCGNDMCYHCGTHEHLTGVLIRSCELCQQSYRDHRHDCAYRVCLCLLLPFLIVAIVIWTISTTVIAIASGCFCCLGCGDDLVSQQALQPEQQPVQQSPPTVQPQQESATSSTVIAATPRSTQEYPCVQETSSIDNNTVHPFHNENVTSMHVISMSRRQQMQEAFSIVATFIFFPLLAILCDFGLLTNEYENHLQQRQVALLEQLNTKQDAEAALSDACRNELDEDQARRVEK